MIDSDRATFHLPCRCSDARRIVGRKGDGPLLVRRSSWRAAKPTSWLLPTVEGRQLLQQLDVPAIAANHGGRHLVTVHHLGVGVQLQD